MNLKNLPTLFIQAALVATATILALVLITKYVAPIPLSINQTTTQKDAAFSVTGKSVMTTIPDKVVMNLGITRRENDLKTAQSESNDIINAITQKLVALGLKKEDIKTGNYSISPTYDYQSGSQKITGYAVDITLNVSTTDLTKINQIVDSATAAGANQVNGIQFTLSDQKEHDIRQQARQQAIDDAKANASELSRLSGMRLGRIINVTEGSNQPVPLPYFNTMAMDKAVAAPGAGGGTPTELQPGSTNYMYTVTLSYETL